MNEPIRIILADDHQMLREGFKTMLRKQSEVVIVAEAENGTALLEQVEHTMPHVVITDIKMPCLSGIDACRQLQRSHPDIGVIALSTFDDDALIIEMIRAGARGYLLKNTDKDEVVRAVKAVYHGGIYYCDAVSENFRNLLVEPPRARDAKNRKIAEFTERELEIIRLSAQQLTSKEIAALLKLSTRTIQSHKDRMQERIDAKSMIGVIMYAVRHKLINVQES